MVIHYFALRLKRLHILSYDSYEVGLLSLPYISMARWANTT